MLTKWKVFNFKSIRKETELDFGPLTIFAGANSSGKSTIIQSILLLAQTMSNKVSSRSVVLNGALTSLGQFDDIKSYGSDVDQITIKGICSPLFDPESQNSLSKSGPLLIGQRLNQFREVSCEISFDADPSTSSADLAQLQPRLFSSIINSVSKDEDNLNKSSEISIHLSSKVLGEIEGIESIDINDDLTRSAISYEVNLDSESLSEINDDLASAQPIGCILKHFLPDRIVYRVDLALEQAIMLTSLLQEFRRRHFSTRRFFNVDFVITSDILEVLKSDLMDIINFDEVFSDLYSQLALFEKETLAIPFYKWHGKLRSLSTDIQIKIQQAFRDDDQLLDKLYSIFKSVEKGYKPYAIIQGRPPKQIFDSCMFIGRLFSNSLKYLGPLRDAPKPIYPLAPAADPNDVGLRGEYTAAVLELHKNKKIKYIPSTHFRESVVNRTMVTRTLVSAVIDWLQYLGVAKTVQTQDKGKLGHELKVNVDDTDCLHDLTHVGVGVSQVLPILVSCLLSETDSTMVFEQPELHLHPSVQTLLGDFFLSMALCNKQTIVETHSEYLIDRLRFRIAAAAKEYELANQVKMYFVEKHSGNSEFNEVVINEYGAINKWPEGFFDQSQKQAEDILKAASIKRKINKANQ